MAYDEGLAERLRQATQGVQGVTEKKMFGGLAMMKDGHMFVGIVDERLMARIGADEVTRALEERHVAPMDFNGRPLKDYVFVQAEGTTSDQALRRWVEKASAFVATLPPKDA